MSSGIYVQPDKLDSYKEEISKTPAMLENIFNENNELINRMNYRIDRTIDMLERKRMSAQIHLENARKELAAARASNATSEEKEDLDYYYIQIDRAEAELQKLVNACNEIRVIKNEYQDNSDQYKRDEQRYYSEYKDLLSKGITVIEKYTELVRRSTSVIPVG